MIDGSFGLPWEGCHYNSTKQKSNYGPGPLYLTKYYFKRNLMSLKKANAVRIFFLFHPATTLWQICVSTTQPLLRYKINAFSFFLKRKRSSFNY